MAVNRSVKIGEFEYDVRFPVRLVARGEIERQTKKGIVEAVFSAMFDDHCVLIWAGIKNGMGKKRITPQDVAALLKDHEDLTGQDYTEVLKQVLDVAFEDKLLGLDTNYDHMRRLLGLLPEQAPPEVNGEAGKASA